MSPPVRVLLAGGPMLEVGGEVVAKRGPSRQRATLALTYLLLAEGRRVPADELAEAVWPESPPASWRASLRKVISDGRTWLAQAGLDAALSVAQSAYRIDLPPWATVDLDEAVQTMHRSGGPVGPEDAARVVDLLERELLPGFDTPWLQHRRAEADELRITALELMSEAHRLGGDHDEAIRAARAVIAVDPLRESAYRLLMVAHRDAGRIGSALRVFEECRQLLAEELGTAPSTSTVAVYQALLMPLAANPRSGATFDGMAPSKARRHFADVVLSQETVVSKTSIGNLEGRLAAIESEPNPDPLARLETLIELGQARWAISGATDQLRRISLAAGEAAIALGSGPHFGAVAALASTTTGIGWFDQDTEDLCQRALVAFGDDDPTRARIIALRSELRSGAASVSMAEEAVAIARRVGEPALLLDMLLVLDQSLAWTPDLAHRLDIEAECASLSEHHSRWRRRPTFEPLTRLQGGDLEWYRAEVDRLADLSTRTTQWEPRFYATSFKAVVAHLAGNLAEAFRLADLAMEQSREEINAVHSAAGLYLALARDGGGAADLLPIVEDMAARNPTISTFAAALTLGRSVVGDHAGVAELLDRQLGPALDDAPRDHVWLLTLGLLAEAAAHDGTVEQARRLLRELDPYAGQLCAGAHATVLLGSVDGYRGALAVLAGDLDLAVEHLRAALALEQRLEAPLMQARTHAWLATALRRRGERAEEHAETALRLAVPAGTALAVRAILATGV